MLPNKFIDDLNNIAKRIRSATVGATQREIDAIILEQIARAISRHNQGIFTNTNFEQDNAICS